MAMNKWIVSGIMASDPELKKTGKGNSYVRFRLAYQRGWGQNKETSFVTCNVFGKLHETVHKLGQKKKKVLLVGEVSILEKDNNGTKTNMVFFNVNEAMFLDSPPAAPKPEPAANEFPEELYDTPSDDDDDLDQLPF